MASGFNAAKGAVAGAQIAVGANVAFESIQGFQGGGVNYGTEVSGMQLGIINVGRHVKGVQLGVINIAEEVDGVALGLVSISRNSIHPVVWAGNLSYTNVGIKFATKYAYTILGVGFGSNETKLEFNHPESFAALGLHLPITEHIDLDLDAAYTEQQLGGDAANRALHARVLPGWSFARHLRVFAGGGARIPLAFDQGSPAVRPEGVVGVQF